jgi:excisionase family DNA binding protein
MSNQENSTFHVRKVAWRVGEWCAAMGLSRPYVQQLINEGEVPSIKVGGARLITMSPEDFIERATKPGEDH